MLRNTREVGSASSVFLIGTQGIEVWRDLRDTASERLRPRNDLLQRALQT
jgi:hypothetical protein